MYKKGRTQTQAGAEAHKHIKLQINFYIYHYGAEGDIMVLWVELFPPSKTGLLSDLSDNCCLSVCSL